MALFVGASDETGGANLSAPFTCGGFVAPSTVWVDLFAPAWQKSVLDGPPPVPYFHFKEWRHKPWRDKYGLSEEDAERRIDAAVDILLDLQHNLFWITQTQPQAIRREVFGPLLKRPEFSDEIVQAQLKTSDFDATTGYITQALDWANRYRPNCTSIDFFVSATQSTTLLLNEWRKTATIFKDHPESHRSRLVGEVLSFELSEDKTTTNYLPMQAADLHLWLIQKKATGAMEPRDEARLDRLFAIEGLDHSRNEESIRAQARRFEDHANGNDGVM